MVHVSQCFCGSAGDSLAYTENCKHHQNISLVYQGNSVLSSSVMDVV